MPPFIDESGHIYLAVHYDVYSLQERLRTGKLFGFFAFYPTARFATNTLYATRLFVAILGVLTTLGVITLTRRLSTQAAAAFAGLFWAAMPYVVFHDRMALHDPLVSACVVWSAVVLMTAFDRDSTSMATFAGILLGLATLTKVSAILYAPLPILAVVAPRGWAEVRRRLSTLVSFAVAFGLPVAAMGLGLAAWGLSTAPQFVWGADSTPWQSLGVSISTAVTWFVDYNSLPFTILAGGTLISGASRSSWVRCALVLSFLISFLGHALLLKLWYPRYLLPSLIPLVILMGIVMAEWIKGAAAAMSRRVTGLEGWKPLFATLAAAVLLAVSSFDWAKSDVAFARDPFVAQLPLVDRFQYLDGWPSGYGLAEVASFLNQQARQSGKVMVVVAMAFRHGPWSLPIAANLDPGVVLNNNHLVSPADLARLAADAQQQPTFLLFEPRVFPAPADLLDLAFPKPKLVFEYKHPRSEDGFQLYAIDRFTQVVAKP